MLFCPIYRALLTSDAATPSRTSLSSITYRALWPHTLGSFDSYIGLF